MDVSRIYGRVEEAIKRKNYDFAVEMLKNQILKFSPNDVKARKLLRATVLEKYKAKGFPNQGQIIQNGLVPRTKMVIGKLLKKWPMVIEEAENYLLYDPKKISVLYALGEACMEQGYIDTAISVFESILAFDSSHVNALKALGRIHWEQHDGDKARNYYQRALRLAPQDNELAKTVKDISAEMTSKTYGQAKSSKDLIRDKDRAQELEENQAILRTDEDIQRAIDRVKKKLVDDPENKRELRKLGDLYLKLEQFDKAVATFNKVIKLDPTLSDIKKRISDCKIAKFDKKLRMAKENAQRDPQNANLKKEMQKLIRDKNAVEIREYDLQVKDQPTDYSLRYKLGIALYQGGRFDEAISNFQHSIKDPKIKAKAYIYMGQAFTKKKEYDLAVEQFNSALESVSTKEKRYLEVLYYLGIAYESGQQHQKAIDTFTNIYKADIGFRDVKDRIQKLKNLAG